MLIAEREPIFATENEKPDLDKIKKILETSFQRPAHTGAKLVSPEGEEIEIPLSLFGIMRQLLKHLTNGQAVSIVPVNKELTTQQAADLLNVSRPYLVKLLERGEIQFRKVNSHRRIRFDDLMAYKAKRDDERKKILGKLSQESLDLGLFD